MDFGKILKILKIILLILLIYTFASKCFANYTEDNPYIFNYNGVDYPIYTVNDKECNDFIIVIRNNGGLQYIYSSDEFYIDYNNGANKVIPTNNAYINKVNIENGQYNLVSSTDTTNLINANGITGTPVYSNFIIYDVYGDIFYDPNPYIINSSTEIETWDFDYLGINLGSVNFTTNKDVLTINYNDNYFLVDLSLYDIEDNVIYIPQQDLNNRIVFNENSSISFEYDSFETVPFTAYNLGSFQFTLTTYEVNELNDNADRNIQYEIMEQNKQAIAEQQKTNDLITSTDFDDNDISMPTIEVNDGGIINSMAGFFDTIYNGFVNGTLYDIVIPIPYTNKNITIPYNYTETQLTNANATYLITLIQLGWWYILGRFMVVNIFSKVIMLMRGSIEKVQMQNVTTQLL